MYSKIGIDLISTSKNVYLNNQKEIEISSDTSSGGFNLREE
jgi:hypothetical protein